MIGQTINQYQVTRHLGSGGMGEVYLAVDSKLDREVALKFLPAQMSKLPDAKARFLQEARAASALNHPNICTIHDMQEHDGRMFIVMEYVEGQTLRERTTPLSMKQILEIGIQVAEGLAAAHEKGIVHRDIKTENIMVRKDGIVQIMDFGLAKLRGASRLTQEGSTVGTMGYMSPEQVQGLEVDHRTDLFSLGVVLYELISGQMPFRGVHETAVIYEIVNVDPQPLSHAKPEVDPELDRILLDCLQKDPDERCQSAKELSRDLRRFKSSSGRKRVSQISRAVPVGTASTTDPIRSAPTVQAQPSSSQTTSPPRSGTGLLPWAVAAALTIAVAALLFWPRDDSPHRSTVRFTVSPPASQGLIMEGGGNLAVSPDGKLVAFCALDSAQVSQLWVRPIDAFAAHKLAGTEDVRYPFWSPDSRYLGFFTLDGKLKKIDVAGGPALVLCDVPSGRGGTWNADGTIVYSAGGVSALLRVSAAGGVPAPVTAIDTTSADETHRWPWFLPDGNRFLYYVRKGGGGPEVVDDSLWIGSLDSSIYRPLIQTEGNAYFANDHLFYMRDQTLMAQPADFSGDPQLGDPFPIAEMVQRDTRYNNGVFSVSPAGTVAFITGTGQVGTWLIRYNRAGEILDTIGTIGQYWDCDLSPDGGRLAVEIIDPISSNTDIWVFDLLRDVQTRLTFDASRDENPVWSPDGKYILFASRRDQKSGVYRKDASGAGSVEQILETDKLKWPISYSSDGRTLVVYGVGDNGTGDDLWSLPMDPETGMAAAELLPFQRTEFDEDDSHLSPDGRWMSFSSNETGRYEVYVRPYPGPGGKWQISNAGGDYSAWRQDGRELYYIAADGFMMAVDVDGSGSSLTVGEPRRLFAAPALQTNVPYAVTNDGQEFIINCIGTGDRSHTINVVVNWDAELESQ